jgi:glucosamine--fructose-6-phosphate aminotransferase (isomerizing)
MAIDEKAGPAPFSHWMMREMHEQPETLSATFARYVDAGAFREDVCGPIRQWLGELRGELLITASGSSRHAGMVAELTIEDLTGLAVDVEYASEYSYRSERATKDASVMIVSQSGETADTLAALRKAKAAGHKTLAITNVEGSTMAREATVSVPTVAGRERAIPATKSFTAQLLVLHLLALLAAETRETMDAATLKTHLAAAGRLPELIASQLVEWESSVKAIAAEYGSIENFLFLGRGVHYPIAREGALKLKESAYLHAEGYPAGELKHGPNALVSDTTPLVMLATVDYADGDSVERYERTLSLMSDMREQGAKILAVANTGDERVGSLAAHTIWVKPTTEWLLPLCEVVPLQMFSYFMSINNGIDVDRPRNLVKAVVEE